MTAQSPRKARDFWIFNHDDGSWEMSFTKEKADEYNSKYDGEAEMIHVREILPPDEIRVSWADWEFIRESLERHDNDIKTNYAIAKMKRIERESPGG